MDPPDPPHRQASNLQPAYGYQEPHMLPYIPPRDYPNPQGMNPCTFPTIPQPIGAPEQFPDSLPAPSNLRPHLPNQSDRFDYLDDIYKYYSHEDIRDMALLDANRMVENEPTLGAQDEAFAALQAHCRERMGFVQASSERLQAATGMRNDHSFKLPDPLEPTLPPTLELSFSPGAQNNGDSGTIFSVGSSSNCINGFSPKTHHISPEFGGFRRDSGFAFRQQLMVNSPAMVEVDPVTGKGLRDWLLTMGKRHGMRKRECTSISLHDHTPKPKTGAFSNILLAHYGQGGKGERIDVYESDVPATFIDEKTGMMKSTLQTWVWFLISRPVLSISEADHTTRPRTNAFTGNYHDHFTKAGPTPQFYSQSENPHTEAEPSPLTTHMTPPPNFPYPIPTSFIVFACPSSNLTPYDEVTETMIPTPFATPVPVSCNNRPWVTIPLGKTIYKRKDYDLSHQGIPLFEFGGAAKVFGEDSIEQFLSVEALGPWYEGDPYASQKPEDYDELHRKWKQAINDDAQKECMELAAQGLSRNIRDPRHEPPTPFQGIWWDRFYKGIYEDAERWRAVRRAMGVGHLRVVVRWVEYEPKHYPDLGSSDEDGQMSGMDTGGVYGTVRDRDEKANASGTSMGFGGMRNERRRVLNRNVLTGDASGSVGSWGPSSRLG